MDCALIISAGRTDLQLLLADPTDGRRIGRLKIGQDKTRRFHQALLANDPAWTIEEGLVEYPEFDAPPTLELTDGLEMVECEWSGRNGNAPSRAEPLKRDDRYLLVAPKLQSAIAALQTSTSHVVGAVVVLNTRRDPSETFSRDRAYHEEPIALGPVLSRWLASVFHLEWGEHEGEFGLGRSGWVDILRGDDQLFVQQRLSRVVLQRIDDAFAVLAAGHSTAVLSMGGGIPGLKEFAYQSAELRFARTVEVKSPESFGPSEPAVTIRDLNDTTEQIGPAKAVELRRHCLKLIRHGDFDGAAILARTAEYAPAEKPWTDAVIHTQNFMHGRALAGNAPKFLDAWRALPRCVLPALRTECALAMGRVPEAIFSAVTFGEAALREQIEAYLRKVIPGTKLRNLDVVVPPGATVHQSLFDARLTVRPWNKKRACVSENGYWRIESSSAHDAIWLQVCGGKNLMHYRNQMNSKIGGMSAKDLRDNLAHTQIDPTYLSNAQAIMIDTDVWPTRAELSNPRLGDLFLSKILVRDVAAECGFADISKRFAQLVQELQQVILDHRIE